MNLFRPFSHLDSFRPLRRGSALVSTLLVIVVLSIIVVAFLQSMTLERQTAQSYLTRYQAQLAADAGLAYAQNLISQTISDEATADPALNNRKVNFITWAYSPSAATFAPYYTGILSNAVPLTPNAPGPQALNDVSRTVWLASAPANLDPPAQPGDGNAGPATDPNRFPGLPADKRCNINFRLPNQGGAARYWIDPSGTAYPVGWVELPTTSNLKVRYAFWVDDEMGRVDLGKVGNAGQPVATPSYRGLPGNLVINNASGSKELANRKYFADADMNALISARNTEEPEGAAGTKLNPLTASVGTARQYLSETARERLAKDALAYTVRDEATLRQPPLASSPSVYDLIPYGPLAGYPKPNPNTIVAQPIAPSERIKKLHQVMALALPDYFRRKNSPPGNVMRIAASIHDYIDPSDFPTLAPELDASLTTFIEQVDKFVNGSGPRPDFPPDWRDLDLNRRWYGIKGGPYINALDFSSNPLPSSGNSISSFTPTYGIYLWNPSHKPVSLQGLGLLVFNTAFAPVSGANDPARPSQAVDGLPHYRYDVLTPTTPISQLAPRELRKLTFTKRYDINKSINSTNITNGHNWGLVIFRRENNGQIHILDGYQTTGSFHFNYKSLGGDMTFPNADLYSDVKDRRQNLALRDPSWLTANNSVSEGVGRLVTYQELRKWHDRPFPDSTGAQAPPIISIAKAPMTSLGELGNIFDPVNDHGVSSQGNAISPVTYADLDASRTPFTGTALSRGGKTLNAGQFDDFFDRYHTGVGAGAAGSGNRNPIQPIAAGWTSYEKYLRLADAALLDLFTLKTPSESRASRPLNFNTPRPFDAATADTAALNPLSTYLEAARARLPLKDGAYNYSEILALKDIQVQLRERLTSADWRLCRPYRNMNDLVLMGIPKAALNGDLKLTRRTGNASQSSMFSTSSGNSARFFVPRATTKNVELNADYGGPNGRNVPVFEATNKDRQALFGRIADQATLRSYRYRIYSVGQVYREGQPNRPLATVYQSHIYDLNPIYNDNSTDEPDLPTLPDPLVGGPAPSPSPPPEIVLHPKTQRLPN